MECAALSPTAFSQDLRTIHRVEKFSVEELVAHLGVEDLLIAVLPRSAGGDVERNLTGAGQPFA